MAGDGLRIHGVRRTVERWHATEGWRRRAGQEMFFGIGIHTTRLPMKPSHHFALLGFLFLSCITHAANARKRPVSLLFIITDQQRWDTLACGGNQIIKTPNLDRLAREGARFTGMYSSCPVCVPARTVILTGQSCSTNRVITNNDFDDPALPTFPTFDQILIRKGWRGEYHGKWHAP